MTKNTRQIVKKHQYMIVTFKTTIQIFINSQLFFCILGPLSGEGGAHPDVPLGSATALRESYKDFKILFSSQTNFLLETIWPVSLGSLEVNRYAPAPLLRAEQHLYLQGEPRCVLSCIRNASSAASSDIAHQKIFIKF